MNVLKYLNFFILAGTSEFSVKEKQTQRLDTCLKSAMKYLFQQSRK